MEISKTFSTQNMGDWKKHQLQKGIRASRTGSGKTRKYLAFPPIDGWIGGAPEKNGYKRGRA